MPDTHFNPRNNFTSSAGKPSLKYNDFDAELKTVNEYLLTRLATATMVATDLNIYRPNLCRYKQMLVDEGVLKVVFISKCKVTGFKAQYLTCDPEIIRRLNR